MAEERQDARQGERSESAPVEVAPKPKKKKRGKAGFLFILFLLAIGTGIGLHFSGYWDGRPFLWSVVPKIPYAGQPLAKLLAVPEQYSLTVAERRAFELEEWQRRLDEKERTLTTRQTQLDTASEDLGARSSELQEREATAKNSGEQNKQDTPTETQKNLMDQVAKTYQDMSPRNAAQIVEQLPASLAVELLQKLPIDIRASILGKMQPRKAADLTELMTMPR